MSEDDRTEGSRESAADLSAAERRIDRRLGALEERLDRLEEDLRDLEPLRHAVADVADGVADQLAESRQERGRVLAALDELRGLLVDLARRSGQPPGPDEE